MKIRKILIGIDDSEFSRYAAEYGFDIAHTYKAEVGLVNITEPVIIPADSADVIAGSAFDINLPMPDMELEKLRTDRSAELLDRTAKQLGEGLVITKFAQYGTTANGIIDCSKEFNADLIVVGTHRRTGIDRLFLGNVAEDVISKSAVPVIVVPFTEPA